jgi:prolyl oligopeptidase
MRYPPSERGPVTQILHGVEVADPYRWLEDPDSPETKEWVAAQNAVTDEYLAGLSTRAWFRERLSAILDVPRAGVPRPRGGRYLLDRNDGSQDQDVVTVAEDLGTLAKGGRVLIDPAELSPDGTVSVREAVLSPDGKRVAYNVSEAGSDWAQIRVRDVDTGADTGDAVPFVKFTAAEWTPDSAGFFYWTYPGHSHVAGDAPEALGTGQVMLHRLGGDPADDELVYRPDNPRVGSRPAVFADGWLILIIAAGAGDTSVVQARRLLPGGDVGPIVDVVTEPVAHFEPVGVINDVLCLFTDLGAPRGKVVRVDLATAEAAGAAGSGVFEDLIPERDDILQRVHRVGGGFLAVYMHEAQHRLLLFDAEGAERTSVRLPEPGSVTAVHAEEGGDECFLGMESFVHDTRAYRVSLSAAQADPLVLTGKTAPVPDVTVERQTAVSADGTKVPYFLLRPAGGTRGAAQPLPTLLYGYGGYGKSLTPLFKACWPAWLAACGALAVANLRGGGEFGEEWHQAGTRERKQKVFDDFIAVGEHLVETGVTTHSQLVLNGKSNGGTLIGAAMTQRPDLAAVALPMVGTMDMLRFHKFTIGAAWIAEKGDPDVAEDFAFLYAYSPLHALRPGTSYPATLVLTGDHDDRVAPAHSYKFAAELQQDQAGEAPVLLRIETATGHGLGKPKRMLAAEFADMLAFAASHTALAPR